MLSTQVCQITGNRLFPSVADSLSECLYSLYNPNKLVDFRQVVVLGHVIFFKGVISWVSI